MKENMNDFRKNMHLEYKKRLAIIIMKFLSSLDSNEILKEFEEDPENIINRWIDRNCLPMGDFSKEDAIKEIEEWQS